MEQMKKIVCSCFITLLFIPIIFGVLSLVLARNFDVGLAGYTDKQARPPLRLESFKTGDLQKGYASWFETALKPRGMITKTYASLRYALFRLGNRTIGKNGDIFESGYIYAEYGCEPQYNMADPESRKAMDEYVNLLDTLNRKLRQYNKVLYVYIAPNKAEFDSDNVPSKYKALRPDNFISIPEYLRIHLQDVHIPYKVCADLQDTLHYPAFYPTGIHWSRTYEQTASSQIVAELKMITGKNYRDLVFGNIKESQTPFWRDRDVFDLLNLWYNPLEVSYYEYEVIQEHMASYDNMRFFIAGDSFPVGREQKRDGSNLYQPWRCILADWLMAWRKLQFYCMGIVPRDLSDD